jgi:hypothetical protein
LAHDPHAGLLLSQLIYWTRVGVHVIEHDGWIFKSREEWFAETGLSRYEQESARQKLVAANLVEEQRVGVPARLCFRVNTGELSRQLSSLIRSEVVQLDLFALRTNRSLVKTALGHCIAYHRAFTEITGSPSNAIYLSRAMQLADYVQKVNASRKNADALDTWFAINAAQWQADTGLSTSKQRKCQKELSDLGLVQVATQTFPRRKLYLKVMTNEVVALYSRWKTESQKPPTDFAHTGKSVGGKKQYWIKTQVSKLKPTASGKNSDIYSQVCQNGTPGTGYQVCQSGTQDQKAGIQDFQSPISPAVAFESSVSSTKTFPFRGGKTTISRLDSTLHTVEKSASLRWFPTSLHAHVDSVKDYKTTTTGITTPPAVKALPEAAPKVVVVVPDLFWPEPNTVLSAVQVEICKPHLAVLPPDRAQVVLDELVANCRDRQIKNVGAWLRKIVALEKLGTFMPELAHQEQEARQAKASHAQRMAQLAAKTTITTQPGTPAGGVPQQAPLGAQALAARARLRELRQTFPNQPRPNRS